MNAKKAVLLLVLFVLVLLELSLVEGMLPYEWPHPISHLYERVLPATRYDPHPNLDLEIEQDLRQNPWHRGVLDGALGILSLGDALLIAVVWRVFKRSGVSPPSH